MAGMDPEFDKLMHESIRPVCPEPLEPLNELVLKHMDRLEIDRKETLRVCRDDLVLNVKEVKQQQESLVILIQHWLHHDKFSHFDRTLACDIQTQGCSMYHSSMALRGKKTVPKGSLAEPVEEEHREELANSGSARRWLVDQR